MIKYKHWTLKKMFAVHNIQYDTINNCMLARVSSLLEKIVPKKHCLCSYNSLSKEDNFQCCIPANMQYLYKTCITFLNWLILNMSWILILPWIGPLTRLVVAGFSGSTELCHHSSPRQLTGQGYPSAGRCWKKTHIKYTAKAHCDHFRK